MISFIINKSHVCLHSSVIPAEAGIQSNIKLAPRFHGGNIEGVIASRSSNEDGIYL